METIEKKFITLSVNCKQRESSILCSLIIILLSLVSAVNAEEKLIPGDAKLAGEFVILSKKDEVEKEFHLYATDGYQEMADGESIYFWGFAHAEDFADAGEIKTGEERDEKLFPLKVPGDEIRLTSGRNYVVVLHNAGFYETEEHSGINHVAHTIHFHGLDLLPAVDGVADLPYPSVFPGEMYRYLLTIPEYIEGSYMGHCHVDSTNHVMAGMYFPLIIEKKPAPGSNIWETPDKQIYGYEYDREYTLFFSEVDSKYMEMLRVEGNIRRGLDWKSDYFMLNGRIFMDNLLHPLSTVNDPGTRIVAYDGETVLIRLMAVGYNHIFSWHPHGFHGLVIGTDGRKLPFPYEKDTLLIGSGERYDVLYKIPDFSSKTRCLSCNRGPGISIAHDHNMMGMVSAGIYPHGPMTVFDIRPKSKMPGNN
ncbi:MAG: multicopper oxidase domain-containing protein [Candidatus Scalindua sp.]|nr:multicopper oxidase domain-containing protein [Candidatus Scalindua sp.]